MKSGSRLPTVMVVCAGLLLQACASAPRPAAAPWFFAVPPHEAAAVQTLIQTQEHQLQHCAAARSCHRAHYLRGLAALYEDRAEAMRHFQAALAGEPEGPVASSSRQWMQVLGDDRNEPARGGSLLRTMERLVREVLENDAAIRQASLRASGPRPVAAAPGGAQSVESLRQQLKERESRIEELTHQIDALKRVDQEVQDRVKPRRQAD